MKKFRVTDEISLYSYGKAYDTEAVIYREREEVEGKDVKYLNTFVSKTEELVFTYEMDKEDIILGLGENMGGINKRGKEYISFCTDDPIHLEDKKSLYGVHPFFIVDGKETFGVFVDYPGKMTFDMGFRNKDVLQITIPKKDVDVYIIEGEDKNKIVANFITLVGQSYVPPRWAFGYQQCRWSYEDAKEVERIVDGMRENNIPCDTVYLDIDYMDAFKDFTVSSERFPDFPEFVERMKKKGIRLIPIIDAGVKVEEGYDVYEEGMEKGYYCTLKDDKEFVGAVWPGHCVFPDFLNPDTRKWWGSLYKRLTDQGIEGFWNDMNEPALFYTPDRLKEVLEEVEGMKGKNLGIYDFFGLTDKFRNLSNQTGDYKKFYHKDKEGNKINHYDVHNLYGYNMTRAASEGFDEIKPNERILMFSRASYQGAHRYGGIWTGDNMSWWSHILLNIQEMASLNMCGFLYTGADTGGFGANADAELVTRWTQFSIFTPLFRNHAAMGTREQEPFAFDKETTDRVRETIKLRYAMIPYIYSEYMKARRDKRGYILPLSFQYEDARSRRVEDQVLCGDSLMLTPVYTQNAKGRYVHLPEDMLMWKGSGLNSNTIEYKEKGDSYIELETEELAFFIKKDKMLPLGKALNYVEEEEIDRLRVIVNLDSEAKYEYYTDNGTDKNLDNHAILNLIVTREGDTVEARVEKVKGDSRIKEIEFIVYGRDMKVEEVTVKL